MKTIFNLIVKVKHKEKEKQKQKQKQSIELSSNGRGETNEIRGSLLEEERAQVNGTRSSRRSSAI